MPFVHQDDGGRDGINNTEDKRQSWGNFFNFSLSPEPSSAPINELHSNGSGGNSTGGPPEWRWNDWQAPASPEAARSPMSAVPPACFPPQHTTSYASYSENARPGDWPNLPEVKDLAASLSNLTMSSASAGSSLVRSQQNIREHQLLEGFDKNTEPSWMSEEAPAALMNSLPNVGVIRRGKDVLRWNGALPPRGVDTCAEFSAKVFLGGLPWDITEESLMDVLKYFRPVRVEWPGREGQAGAAGAGGETAPRGGYAYVTFENERCVRSLLSAAHRDGTNWFYRFPTRNMRNKEVQVIPWAVSDANWVLGQSARLESSRTVFVGALHGMLTAYALAIIMNDLFEGVVYAGIDTDKNKYPIGSGRVTFNNVHSYVLAVSAKYVEVVTDKFTKTVQVDPYLEDTICSLCNLHSGPYFCRDPKCFSYFCRSCWARQHLGVDHKKLTRNSKSAYNDASASVSSAAAAAILDPAGLAPVALRSRKQTRQESNKFAAKRLSVPLFSEDHGSSISPVTVPIWQKLSPRAAHSQAAAYQSYQNGLSDGMPSLSPTDSSDLQNFAERIS